ncbi:MAG: acyl-CoA dehydrogenase family protein [Deltaproteobacteria bacterium]|jgi:alkylation response protein AidB-like acyl-CoA dehydrogenase|nr:acyl-CoA dehydrogenase family protein [Deltaproteobacteria bacterium]
MNLNLSEEQQILRDTFAELFAAESSCDRVRAAEPLGHDPALWKTLVETEVIGMRVPQARGGTEASLLDAALVAEQAGRHLASAPLVETIVAGHLVSRLEGSEVDRWLEQILSGNKLVSIALFDAGDRQIVPGGAVTDAIVGLDGHQLVLVERESQPEAPGNLGSSPVARWRLGGERIVLASGEAAIRAYGAAREEWKLLTAAFLAGLARRALEIAAKYATERIQFERQIGSFQGIAHPLADSMAAVEGARLLVWRAIWAIAHQRPEAAALVSASFAWAAESTTKAVARALHTFGGYGLSLEYDIQLYHRRGKAWPLLAGDPHDELQHLADRTWGGADVPLPDTGEIGIDFGLGERAEAFRPEVRRFFEENLTDELRAFARYDWEGHHPEFHKLLAENGLAFASWPKAYGGQERDPYEMTVLREEFHRAGWTTHAIATASIIGETLLRFAGETLKQEVITRICSGDVVVSMGYTEPGSGSDVAAAQTRAVREGDEWIINGQKMFTSGANRAHYVFLLTRTDSEAPKHRGLTMFLVPLDSPGIEIQPIHTLGDERTNATYYTDVRVPDTHRVGDVNGGWTVLLHALELEQGGGGTGSYHHEHLELLDHAIAWARRAVRNGRPAIDDPRVRERLARSLVRTEVAQVLGLRALWAGVEDVATHGEGPMAKLFGAEALIENSADLMDLAAPDSILDANAEGAAGDGQIEYFYRMSAATSVYGGSSEIMRSIVAQVALGMPRSRS